MSDNRCKWRSKHNSDYQCKEPITCDDSCVLHYSSEDKTAGDFDSSFEKKVRERIDTKEAEIDLTGCYFPKDFPAEYFQIHTFDKPVDFSEATFSQEAYFLEATFSQKANFSWAKFSQVADFAYAKLKEADFAGATFSRADFFSATFSQVNFSRATFSQVANFSWATFSQAADFSGATFSQVYFYGATFSQGANFFRATFSQVNFSRATFSQVADFSWATSSRADFSGTHFEKGAIFSYAEFQERVQFLPIEIEEEEKKELIKVILGPSKFHYTRFLGEVRFQDADLSQCSFIHSNIDKVDFRYCEFGEVKEKLLGIIPSPRRNVLRDEKDCDKEVGTALMAVRERTGASPVPTEKDAREGYEPVRRLYQELKKNFEEKKDWNTAGDFHYGEMECRRKMKGTLGREFFSLEAIYRRASGYGERPWRAGFWLGTLILSFTLFYLPPTGKVSPSPKVLSEAGQALLGTDPKGTSATTTKEDTKEASQAQPPKERDIQSQGEATGKSLGKRCLNGLKTSLRVTFHLETEEKGWPRTIQSILGPILIALFFLALRRKVKR